MTVLSLRVPSADSAGGIGLSETDNRCRTPVARPWHCGRGKLPARRCTRCTPYKTNGEAIPRTILARQARASLSPAR